MNTNLVYTSHSKKWFLLAITAISIAGLYALPPVILRGSAFSKLIPVEDIFASSLVIHVNLSVLVWMLAITALLWSTIIPKRLTIALNGSCYACFLGLAAMVLSSWFGYDQAIKNNYIPTIYHPLFFIGLGLFGAGILLAAFLTCYSLTILSHANIKLHIVSTAIMMIIASICFFLATHFLNNSSYSLYDIYEHIHWGGGHVLQFIYTASMMIIWCLLIDASNPKKNPLSKHPVTVGIFVLHLILTLPTPTFYFITENSVTLFTQHMRYVGGIAPFLLSLLVIVRLLQPSEPSLPTLNKTAIITSLLLFGFGGSLGFMIQGTNVTIPAHYHGSIVGITVAFMGFCYTLLPNFHYKSPSPKWSISQLITYTIGQTAHISGLALMGGYGALRKAPGTIDQIETTLGKILFFSGGGLSIIGGSWFVIFMLWSISTTCPYNKKNS